VGRRCQSEKMVKVPHTSMELQSATQGHSPDNQGSCAGVFTKIILIWMCLIPPVVQTLSMVLA
jgi:hypothetical protein